ncbi:MAG: YqhA family protein [Hyphomicrobiales bacterium]
MSSYLNFLFRLRFLMLLGSVGAIFGSLLMFWVGGLHLVEAAHALLSHAEGAETRVVVFVLEAVDAFLFGIVLVIFAVGIAVGFVVRLGPDTARTLPSWMKIDGVGQLKQILAEVVIVVLIVIFARLVVEARGEFNWTILVLPVSVLLIAIAIRVLGLDDGHGSDNSADAGKGIEHPGEH